MYNAQITSNDRDFDAQLDLYSDCGLSQYHSSVFSFEGCVHLWSWPGTAGLKVSRNMLDFPQKQPAEIPSVPLQEHLVRDGVSEESIALSKDASVPSYAIVYSCESSEYCAFQAQAAYYAFLSSGQHPS